ncbi:hypothetical protein Tco_0260993 [Tanacetum coccineum]
MSQPANDEFSQHLSDDETSNHEDASDTITAAEIQAVEKERKTKNILLMAIPKEHMRRFHGMDDAKEIWEAIRTRFGGNANSKKMQKAIFKQQFEALTISSSEGLEKGYDRFQQLLSQLEAHGAEVSTEDANHNTNKVKFGFTGAYSTCNPSISSTNATEKEVLAGFVDEVIYSLFAKQTEDLDLLHEDLEQIDDVDIEERSEQIDDLDIEKMGHVQPKGTHDVIERRVTPILSTSRSREAREKSHGLATMNDGKFVNWGYITEVEETNHALWLTLKYMSGFKTFKRI